VVFTSGATGPAKGVAYRHRQVQAQVELIRTTYALTDDDRIVAAFAPFSLYGPALGIGSAVPKMDVTSPGTLTAAALADAVLGIQATVVFASPAALRNVVATADAVSGVQLTALAGVRLLMSAGAPVPAALLRAVRRVLPGAEAHTPYGMTEVLPVTDIDAAGIDAAGAGQGVCVGVPLPGVTVAISELSEAGAAEGPPLNKPHVIGEVCVSARHVKDRYDSLWATQRVSARDAGWHRTGDVGHLDEHGRLWIEGRLEHVIATAAGVVTPVGIEQRAESLDEVRDAAAVGVGPAGTAQVIVVVVLRDRPAWLRRSPVAPPELTDSVRRSAGVDVAAVLVAPDLPVDIRHNSKVDRREVAAWAAAVLAGASRTDPNW
jgi:acyl-coenzyme A synthetase/AMP-(fatty) acid ligase